MKLKQQPADFQVEELPDSSHEGTGPFGFYELKKRGLGTPEALQAICRRWKLDLRRVSHGGLKDRHADTTQYVSIWQGPRRHLKQSQLSLRYLGQRQEPYGSDQVRGNRFRVVLRDLAGADAEQIAAILHSLTADGVPNYFDDQRFGSVGPSRQFVARKLIDGDYEGAVKLALAEPYEFDSSAARQEKRVLRELWGNWDAAQGELGRGNALKVVSHLVERPTDFRGAFARIGADLKSLYLAAYQSHLWNQLLGRWIERECRPDQIVRIRLRLGPVAMYQHLDATQRERFSQQMLPLPSARLHLDEQDPLKPLIDAVMAAEGLSLSQMKLKHFREPFFSKGDRQAIYFPEELSYQDDRDELNIGRRKLAMSFILPRGCYATMLVKRITS